MCFVRVQVGLSNAILFCFVFSWGCVVDSESDFVFYCSCLVDAI